MFSALKWINTHPLHTVHVSFYMMKQCVTVSLYNKQLHLGELSSLGLIIQYTSAHSHTHKHTKTQ